MISTTITVLLLGILGGSGFFLINRLTDSSVELALTQDKLITLHELDHNMRQIYSLLELHVRTDDGVTMGLLNERIEKRNNQVVKKILHLFNEQEINLSSDEQSNKLYHDHKRLQFCWSQFSDERSQVLGLSDLFESQKAKQILIQKAAPLYSRCLEMLRKEINDLSSRTKELNNNASILRRSSITIIIGFTAAITIVILFGGAIVTRSITQPIRRITEGLKRSDNISSTLSEDRRPKKDGELGQLIKSLEFHVQKQTKDLLETNRRLENEISDKQRWVELLGKTNSAYYRFVPHEFLNMLEKESVVDLELGNQVQKTMTVLFSDIRNFTSLSEDMLPQETFNFLNAYLSRIGPLIRKNNGFIDKYLGDGFMALFDKKADHAVNAALTIMEHLEKYNMERSRAKYKTINIGIGIHMGELILGTIGECNRMDGTVISDAVNLASRLEGLTKFYGATILISDQTLNVIHQPHNFDKRFIARTRPKGKKKAISVYEIFNHEPDDIRLPKLENLELFEDAVALYYFQQIDEASELIKQYLIKNPKDKVGQLYLQRCQNYLRTGQFEDSEVFFDEVVWTEDYATNIRMIDDQHQFIINQINQTIEAFKQKRKIDGFNKLISLFNQNEFGHFSLEEEFMQRYDYPDYTKHKDMHSQFLNNLEKFSKDFSGKNNKSIQDFFKTQNQIVDWIVNHFTTADKHLGAYLKRRI